jgi:uncharacterized protein
MMITGKIKNVVDYGAYVDVGIKEMGLVHISELSDHFVQDPMDAVRVGEVYEFRIIGLDADRRRISLSRRSGQSAQLSGAPKSEREKPSGADMGKARAVMSKQGGGTSDAAARPAAQGGSGASEKPGRSRSSRYDPNDDGTMYNPFAAAFQPEKKRVK